MRHTELIRFGAFSLAPQRRELHFGGAQVKLGSRAFDLLLALIESRGRLASKDELMAHVWTGTVVDENNLAAQISALRKMLMGDPALSKCLQTVPGRGYRFVADVSIESQATIDQRGLPGRSAGADTLSLIVLPFRNLSSEPNQAYFAQGLSHTVATDLSRISGLLVISPSTAATFEDKSPDERVVSRELGTRYVLTGSVQRSDGQVRINAQLVDGQTGVHIWSERLDGDDSDLFALQDRITGRIANAISREIFVAAARDGEDRNIDPNSFDLVMQGMAADNRPQTLQSLQQQVTLFAKAAELDPNHSDAHARLARAILLQITQGHSPLPDDQTKLNRGIIAARRALALNPGNALAHCAIGLVHVHHGDFERAVLANETAIALDRNFSLVHNNLGNSLVHLGKGAEALEAVDMALRLDPRGPQVGAFWTTQGFAHLLMGNLDEAVASFSRGCAANPRLPRAHAGLAISLALNGETAAARHATEELLNLVPQYRLSQTMDACMSSSTKAYRDFYQTTLHRGALLSDLPI